MLSYVSGDVTQPNTDAFFLIQNCNDIGVIGGGVSGAIGRRWPKASQAYLDWARGVECPQDEYRSAAFSLGAFQVVPVEQDKFVVNIIGQHKIGKDEQGRAPIRYVALGVALCEFAFWYKNEANDEPIVMPKIGSQLSGGNWHALEQIVYEAFILNDIPVTVYEL